MISRLSRTDYLARDRTHLANERTFLAYLRTSFACILLGAAMIKFSPDERSILMWGIVIIFLGVGTLFFGVQRFIHHKSLINKR